MNPQATSSMSSKGDTVVPLPDAPANVTMAASSTSLDEATSMDGAAETYGELPVAASSGDSTGVSSAVQNYERTPRTLTICRGTSKDIFDVRHGELGVLLYRIFCYKEHRALVMELLHVESGTWLSLWHTFPGHTACVCCCRNCLFWLTSPEGHKPKFSLKINSNYDLFECKTIGGLKLLDDTIHVYDSSIKDVYMISCRPVDEKFKITGVNSASGLDGFSTFNNQVVRIEFPPEAPAEEMHNTLLLAGVFAMHFVGLIRCNHKDRLPGDRARHCNLL